ncbi:hypothetical protein JOF29_003938 [Kribbella aluminosa]|uniref:Twin-arginine translocation signal domain-containing protein n=1 Tax=Kribbella aluminosa TaxID=416017 RepID=A0ABS4UMM0_9ACTN|nr:hypothetical protein [Kribbella aluminosa]MBP2352855.1 hypothetical protein [Kribbella aluminosa]
MRRRDFLGLTLATAAAGAATTLPAHATAPALELTRPYRVFRKRGLSAGAWVTTPQTGRYVPSAAEWLQSSFTQPTFYERDFYNPALMSSLPKNTPWGIAAYPRDDNWGQLNRGPAPDEQVLWTPAQRANAKNLLTFNVGDEESYSEQVVEWLRQWFGVIRTQVGDDVLVHNNQPGVLWPEPQLHTYVEYAKPDLLTTDWYHFQSPAPYETGNVSDPYDDIAHYRRVALAGLDGDYRRPIAFGHYSQGYKGGGDAYNYVPSESELAFLYFMPWTMGARWVMYFRWELDPAVFLLNRPDGSHSPQFGQLGNIVRQSRTLSPYLVQLLTEDVHFVTGVHRDPAGAIVPNRKPEWIDSFTPDPAGIVGVSSRDIGGANDGHPGDVLIGSFRPLPGVGWRPGRRAFMVLNGLIAPNPSGDFDATGGFAAGGRQEITLTFAHGKQLLRADRRTGRLIPVPLRRTSGTESRATITVDGGFADLLILD